MSSDTVIRTAGLENLQPCKSKQKMWNRINPGPIVCVTVDCHQKRDFSCEIFFFWNLNFQHFQQGPPLHSSSSYGLSCWGRKYFMVFCGKTRRKKIRKWYLYYNILVFDIVSNCEVFYFVKCGLVQGAAKVITRSESQIWSCCTFRFLSSLWHVDAELYICLLQWICRPHLIFFFHPYLLVF